MSHMHVSVYLSSLPPSSMGCREFGDKWLPRKSSQTSVPVKTLAFGTSKATDVTVFLFSLRTVEAKAQSKESRG